MSSSSSGYLIIPNLTDSNYNISIGFPKKEFPEENFTIKIDNKNEGFLLKNFDEKGWGLFNIESYAVMMGSDRDSVATSTKNIQSDPFSKMLATVVKDSTILQKNEPVKAKETPAATVVSATIQKDTLLSAADTNKNIAILKDTISSVEKKDTLASSARRPDSTLTAATLTDTSIKTPTNTGVQPLLLSPATRILRKKNKAGIQFIYVDYNMDKDDTIKIFMPYEKDITKETVKNNSANSSDSLNQNVNQEKKITNDSVGIPSQTIKTVNTDTTVVSSISSAENKNETQKNNSDTRNALNTSGNDSAIATSAFRKDTAINGKDDMVVLPQVVTSTATNSDCKAFASNEDFLKLRKKMASENDNDDMITVAKKTFRSKCFSTEQIKNLSYLFLTNEGKYMFFEIAYPFVSDSNQFTLLQSQLTDNYYINRFKAMINK